MVYAGTNILNLHDLKSDEELTLGFTSDRLKHSKKKMQQVREKYNTDDITTYGHSLGGYLAEHSNPNGKVVTFNKASTPFGKPKNKNQIDIRTRNDLVSWLGLSHKNQIILEDDQNPLSSHGVSNLRNND